MRPIPQRDSARGRTHNFLTKKQIDQQNKVEFYIKKYIEENTVSKIEDAGVVIYDLQFRLPLSTKKSEISKMLKGDSMRISPPDGVNCQDFLDNRVKNLIIKDDANFIFGGNIKRWSIKDGITIYIKKINSIREVKDFFICFWNDIEEKINADLHKINAKT